MKRASIGLAFVLLFAVHAGAQQCDQTLWRHVYHQARLKVLQPCIAVTGTIVDATAGKKKDGVRHEADGDTHGWVKLDAAFSNLLDDGNRTNEGGNLVFEVVCKYPVKQADARQACRNYHSPIALPAVGCMVRITGSLVEDQEHAKWNEIHPVTKIEVLTCPGDK